MRSYFVVVVNRIHMTESKNSFNKHLLKPYYDSDRAITLNRLDKPWAQRPSNLVERAR